MTDLVFRTEGNWDTTTLFEGGVEVLADRLYVELRAGRDDDGDPISGGLQDGADFTAYVAPSDNPDQPWDVFPGRLTFQCPDYEVILENTHPEGDPRYLRVWLNQEDISNRVIDVVFDINAPADVASAFVTVFKNHFFVRDEIITYTLL